MTAKQFEHYKGINNFRFNLEELKNIRKRIAIQLDGDCALKIGFDFETEYTELIDKYIERATKELKEL